MIASEILTPIRKFCVSYIEELGSTEVQQNPFLYSYLSLGLKRLAHLAYVVRVSDVLSISTNGYQSFQVNGSALSDMYAPLRMISASGEELPRRAMFTGSLGWYREASNIGIHTKGLSGNVLLYYVAYPKSVAQETDVVEFPDAAALGLVYYVSGMVMESLPNAKDLATHYYALAAQHLKISVLANKDARGLGSGGYMPHVGIVDEFFKG